MCIMTKLKPKTKTWANLEKMLQKMEERVGGMGNNFGDVAEDFFFFVLSTKKRLGTIHFDDVTRNVHVRKGEYDIVLYNKSAIGVVEVKHKVHPNDVTKFVTETIPLFKRELPQDANLKTYGAIAGLSVPKDARDLAEKLGLFGLTQSGETLKVANTTGFTPKVV